MKKFLVIYAMPAASMAEYMQTASPEEQKQGMAQWKEWMDAHAESFAEQGAPAGKNTRLTAEGASEVSNDIGGYSIMQAENKEDVIDVLSESPHNTMPGAYTEVMELTEM